MSSEETEAAEAEARVNMAELLWAMRKAPDLRASHIHRARKLIAEPGYPPKEVIEAVADLLAKRLGQPTRE
jgi:hypothetical protein